MRARHAKEYGHREVPGDERLAGQEGENGRTDRTGHFRFAESIQVPRKKRGQAVTASGDGPRHPKILEPGARADVDSAGVTKHRVLTRCQVP